VVLIEGDGKAWLDDVTIEGANTANTVADLDSGPTPEVQNPTVAMRGYWSDYPQAWMQTHQSLVENAKKANPKIVFLGDSITQGWGSEGKTEWEARFAPKDAVNLGIGGDRTQQVLWRIQHGAIKGLNPQTVVLLIGVNNLWRDVAEHKPEGVVAGAKAVVQAIRQECPNAKVLVLGILPTGQELQNPLRQTIRTINAGYATLADNKTVFYRDIGSKFVEPDGTIRKEIMPDFLHLSPAGYKIFADNLEPLLAQMSK
jgi:lysophospholipase L1-like esterase